MRHLSPIRISAATFILLSLIFGAGSFRLGFWHEAVPGPGLLPLAASSILLPLSVWIMVRPSIVTQAEPFHRTPLTALALLAVYAIVLPGAGFALPTVVVLAIWAKAFHGQPLRNALAMAVALVAGVVLLFRMVLGVPIPVWPLSS